MKTLISGLNQVYSTVFNFFFGFADVRSVSCIPLSRDPKPIGRQVQSGNLRVTGLLLDGKNDFLPLIHAAQTGDHNVSHSIFQFFLSLAARLIEDSTCFRVACNISTDTEASKN